MPTNKIQVLENIFDKVFKRKNDMETQLDYLNTSFDRKFRQKSNVESMDMINLNGIGNFQKKKKKLKVSKLKELRSKSHTDLNEFPIVQSSKKLY